ncbi:hypothetical protein [Ferruginibacter albus]|uniref:hypothetical protein n=1 Tax=Ferruginibacter albus TaxID=2875540 RepID=UPI001CC42BBD|nr:hypothetical protein [Ferruginibacter albus]UAY53249.1 hypothetical protein K9M53_06150 [Ferruginibacter albus]
MKAAPQFVGAFSGDVFVSSDGKSLIFVISDSKSTTSFLYRAAAGHDRVNNSDATNFYSNTYQKYIWTEPIDDKYYDTEKRNRTSKGYAKTGLTRWE